MDGADTLVQPAGLLTGGNAQELLCYSSRRVSAGGRHDNSNQRLPQRDTPESSNVQRAVAGENDLSPQDVELILARFDLLEFRLDSMDRRVDKLEAFDRRVTKSRASKATYRRYSSNYDIDPYQQPTRFRPCHEHPPGWPPPQRSPQRRRQAYERQQQTHAYRQQHEPVVAHMEPLSRVRNLPAATTQSRSSHEQPTIVLQPLLSSTTLQCSAIPPMASAAVPPPSSHPPSLHSATKLVSCEEEYLGVEGDSQVLNQGDLRLNGMKSVDEEFCNEIEWVPNSHSSSLDHKSDDHQIKNKNDYLNWRGSFLDEVDESKSSLLDDDYENKATFDDDELTKTEHRSVKRCFGSNDEDEVDGVGVLSQHQKLIQQMMVELKSCDIRCLPTICKDSVTPKMIEDLRPRKFNHMIRNKDLKETKAFTAGKTRADSVLPRLLAGKGRLDLEVVYVVAFDPGGKVSMLLVSSTLSVVPWFPP